MGSGTGHEIGIDQALLVVTMIVLNMGVISYRVKEIKSDERAQAQAPNLCRSRPRARPRRKFGARLLPARRRPPPPARPPSAHELSVRLHPYGPHGTISSAPWALQGGNLRCPWTGSFVPRATAD